MLRRERLRCREDGQRISGTVFFPSGKGPFPLVVYSHGYGYDVELIPLGALAERGIAVCKFDFRGGSPRSRSGGRPSGMSVLTEADDLEAVLDALTRDPRIDPARVYLLGASQGGYVSTVVGVRRKGQVRGALPHVPRLRDIRFQEAPRGRWGAS